MNNDQRNEIEEMKAADRTARILETGDFEATSFETAEENQTLELGRLLRQSAKYELPESSDDMRQRLLEELESDAVVSAPTKSLPAESEYRVSRKRMWMGLATGALIAVGGSFMYSSWAVSTAQLNHKSEVRELEARAEAAERSVNEKPLVDRATFEVLGDAVSPVGDPTTSDKEESDPGRDYDSKAKTVPSFHRARVEGFALQGPKNDDALDIASSSGQEGMGGPSSGMRGSEISVEQIARDQYQQGGQQQGQRGGQQQAQSGQQGQRRGVQLSQTQKFVDRGRQANSVKRIDSTTNFGIKSDLGVDKQKWKDTSHGSGQASNEKLLKGESSAEETVELPRLATTTINSVVDVPDDGTVLMGGIKRTANSNDYFESKNNRFRPVDVEYQPQINEKYSENPSRDNEQYTPIHENQFVQATGGAAISTFSIDVDTASYANMRRFLSSGQRPPRDSVRIEELVNYFQYDYPQPKGDDPFSVNLEMATCPWNDSHKLLRVGLKGKEIHVDERPATNVVYLIDVSGSMNSQNKLPLLKRGFQMMTKQLGENDRVSIVTYAGNAGVALEPTTGDNTKTISEAIERLSPGGSTHGSAGIELAYKLAQQHFIQGGVNKVILATDGDLNVGVTDDDSLVKLIKQKASEGVFLTVLGFGTGNLKDGKLERIADNGNGHYAYIDSNREAHRVLVQQMSGSLVTIAKDVKIQIEFNPAEVKSYRLIGYENRMLQTKDFDDDRKDAGEIGAGHTVTAIYELETTGDIAEAFTAPAGMKYQATEKAAEPTDKVAQQGLTDAAASGELATVALRYKKPDENESKRIEFAIKNDERSFGSASEDFRFATSVAGFGMLLRGSEHAGNANFEGVLKMASDSIGDDASGYRAEFVDLIRKACYGQ